MIGLAMRAGKVAIGTDLVIRAMRERGKGAARLVLISNSASDSTKKKICFKCEFYKIPVMELVMDSSELGSLLGKLYAPAAIAITDDSFAKEIRRILTEISDSDQQYRDITTQRKEVSTQETGDNYASNTSENNSDI